uniref:Integrase catalytic domain-containing protein n=1 Tax=Lactuca sativa TaxID=4236 RepID=A0A9R1X3Q5_LACSA|nr:hypothetical protein LSAT_V11C700366270 [Lactuca sativa]
MVIVQFGKHIKRVRSDNGGEFTSNHMLQFYNEHGILLETTCPHTPQQNGVVERKHIHFLETAHETRFEANLPNRFWGECILTAAYIINRLPSKVIKNKTPYEIVWNQKPQYDHMQVLGCLAYYRNTDTKGEKFENKGKPGVFLGYPQGTKGYKIYDIESRKIIISREVLFHESTLPFKNEKLGQDDGDEEPVKLHNDVCCEEHTISKTFKTISMNELTHEAHVLDDHVDSIGHENDEHNNEDVQWGELNHDTTNVQDDTIELTQKGSRGDESEGESLRKSIRTESQPQKFKDYEKRWKHSMQQEIRALEKNDTWTLTDLPNGQRAIESKWVYKIKYKQNGEVERYKSRLVAKGFTQMEGVDYHDTFAPVAKLVTMRTLLSVAAKKNHQLDVNNAFLHGDLDEEVYMKVPQGFSKEGETRVCRLHKSLHGLKQASRNWYQKFTKFLLSINFRQSKEDHSLFLQNQEGVYTIILIYVDDVIIAGNDLDHIKQTKIQLDKAFSIKDLGQLRYFLGIEVEKTLDSLVLSQRKYILDILKDSGMLGCKPSAFPIEHNLKLDRWEEEARVDAGVYIRLFGRLLYLQATHPDVAYSVNVLSQFVGDPRTSHMQAVMRVLRYLKGTAGQDILLPHDGEPVLTAFSDFDWLGCPYTRRSRTARHIVNNPVYHERMKHVEIDCFFIREGVASREIKLMKIDSKMQVAHLLKKGLGTTQFHFLLGKLEKHNNNNYKTWETCLKSYLQGQDLWEVVGGSETTPPEEDVNGDLHKWKIKAGKAMFALKTTFQKEMLEHIRDENTPKEAWDTFVTLISKKNDTRLQLLENELLSISQRDLTIAQYFHKVKAIYREITKLDPQSVITEARMKRIIIHGLRRNIEASLLLYKDSPFNHHL